MLPQTDDQVAGLVLAAGGSRRLGRPKQLLPYGDGVLLDAALTVAKRSGFSQVVVALGGAEDDVRKVVDLGGVEIADNPDFAAGCSSSIAAAIPKLADSTDVLVLMLGDQPGVQPETVRLTAAGAR